MDADDLQSVDFHFFVVQNPNPGAFHGIEILHAVGEFFMIASDIINSRRGGKALPRLEKRIQVRLGPVKQIAADMVSKTKSGLREINPELRLANLSRKFQF